MSEIAEALPAFQPAPVFVDWIDIFQTWPDAVTMPVVGDGYRLKTDIDVDQLRTSAISSLRHEGSYSTSVSLRSDGHYVHVKGNVGRLGRRDNVFNLDWPQTFDACGDLSESYGCPRFSLGEHYLRPVRTERDARLGLFDAWTGARLSELHLTRNYSAGSDGMANQALRHFFSQRAARLSKSRLGATTVVFGSHAKGGRQVQVYLKADEMLAHAKGEKAKEAVRNSQLYQWARDVGLLRVECKLRRMALRDAGLNYAGGITMQKIVSLFERHTQFLSDASPERICRLADQLPRKLRLVALAWLRGDDLATTLSRSSFYRYARSLREYGMDITEPRGISDNAELQLQQQLDRLPDFKLVPLREPEWYSAIDEHDIRKAA